MLPDNADPASRVRALVDGLQVSQAIYVLVTLGIPDHLTEGAVRAETLAGLVGAHPRSLYRLLRALASVGILDERDDHVFALTAVGDYLRSDAAQPIGHWARIVGRPHYWEAWGHLLDSVQTGENAFQSLHGGQSVWEWRSHLPEERALFDRAMMGNSRQRSQSFLNAFDFGQFSTVADIGGGNGAFLAALLVRHPSVKGVLFDQPSVVSAAQSVVAGAGVGDRCDIIGGDFFSSVPAGAGAYVLKNILHDWDDGDCVKLLRVVHSACAAAPVLVLDWVLAPANEGPLGKFSDLNMLVMPGGQERTEDEWRSILEQGGFRLETVVEAMVESAGGQSVIVANAI